MILGLFVALCGCADSRPSESQAAIHSDLANQIDALIREKALESLQLDGAQIPAAFYRPEYLQVLPNVSTPPWFRYVATEQLPAAAHRVRAATRLSDVEIEFDDLT